MIEMLKLINDINTIKIKNVNLSINLSLTI